MRHAILSAHAESQRRASRDGNRAGGALGPWNGEIRDPAVLGRLAKRFGPDRLWSASQLEKYASNPFLFFVERVLYLKELEEAEESTTALVRGGLAHTILERFHRSYDGAYPTELTGDVRLLLDDVVAFVFAEAERSHDTWLGRPVLWAATKEDLHDKVGRYLEWELPRLTGRVPIEYELGFGFDDRPPFVLRGQDVAGVETELLLRGKVDRVDRASTGAHYVLDYKSGFTPNRKAYLDGGALQGPIYMAAVADALKCDVKEAAYYSIKNTIKKKTYTGEATVKIGSVEYQRALVLALSIPSRVRAGKFEPRAAASIDKWLTYWIGADVCRVTELHVSGECRFDE